MKVTLLKINFPTSSDWGIVQIEESPDAYYRFKFNNEKPVLDTVYYSAAIEVGPKQANLTKDSPLYQAVQQLLDNYCAEHFTESIEESPLYLVQQLSGDQKVALLGYIFGIYADDKEFEKVLLDGIKQLKSITFDQYGKPEFIN